MSSKTNDTRSNIIFLIYKIYTLFQQHKLEPIEWEQESFKLSWDGKQTLKLEKSTIVLASVKDGNVILSTTIMEYYHLPYSWLLDIQKSFENQ
ncbi:hypothetical protein [Cytobacillus dafuensis]|uniref:Uncharacterized protein n=1 Tax=Cytobacillus dafuensis TaxID=1742359 RepID=A0A5B8Z5T0_CYTDA|nr:hypothetical protein [Cytobacillus dafuensis]QED46969.1 hypothetical protein FSZ17_06725 [Cytobacillus dafuensis]